MSPTASPLVTYGIPAIALLMAALLTTACLRLRLRTGLLLVAVWLLPSAALSLTGVLAASAASPAPAMPLVGGVIALTLAFAFSPSCLRLAQALPLGALVASQAFRLPLELLMHRAATEGVMPPQMSWSGLNLDVLSGASALLLGLLALRGPLPRGLVLAWNVLGTALLLTIMGVAIASLPWLAAFGPERLNTWVLHFPFVWLPTALVPSAVLGHTLVFRRLWHARAAAPLSVAAA